MPRYDRQTMTASQDKISFNISHPTRDPEINALLHDILTGAREILEHQFFGMYLEGSLATETFDGASDVDFVVVTDGEISPARFARLQAMHSEIAAKPLRWAREIEGSYVPCAWVSDTDAVPGLYPNIQRGPRERLILDRHDHAWITHRYVLREHGIVLAGPAPSTFMAPISPSDLRRAIRALQEGWLASIIADPDSLRPQGYQCYVVLTLCRMRYTMEYGTVVPKPVAVRWAEETLDVRWRPLIARAWTRRSHPRGEATPEEMQETLAFLREVRDAGSEDDERLKPSR